MQYLGGKSKIAKNIAEIIQPLANTAQMYCEPFVGAGWVLSEIKHPVRIAADVSLPLISLLQAVSRGWMPPDSLSEAEYKALRAFDPTNPLVGFAGYGCSFGGRYFEGYARNSRGDNYARAAKNSLMRKDFHDVTFHCCHYKDFPSTEGAVYYCDPPYANTKKYSATPSMCYNTFWEWARMLSDNNIVFISEYVAPDDFYCVAEFPTKLNMRTRTNILDRTEKLFKKAC